MTEALATETVGRRKPSNERDAEIRKKLNEKNVCPVGENPQTISSRENRLPLILSDAALQSRFLPQREDPEGKDR